MILETLCTLANKKGSSPTTFFLNSEGKSTMQGDFVNSMALHRTRQRNFNHLFETF